MDLLEKEISNVLKELDRNIKEEDKKQIEANRKLLDKLLEEYLKKYKK